MTAVQFTLAVIGFLAACSIVTVALWLYGVKAPEGSRKFKDIPNGSYFHLVDSATSPAFQKTGRRFYTPLQGADRFDKIQAEPNMRVYRVEHAS